MVFHEFGNPNGKVLLLQHGMMQKWQTMYDILKPLEEDYRLIIPALTGYTDGDENYVSFSDECRQIEEYVTEHYNGRLRGVYGISQGATILSELLARNNVRVEIAVLDGIYVAHQGKLCGKIGAAAIRRIKKNRSNPLKGLSWAIKLMGMTEDDIKNELGRMNFNFPDEHLDRYFIENYTYRANTDLSKSETTVYLRCGEKKPYALKSHKIMKPYLKNYKEQVFRGMGHSNMPVKYSGTVIKLLSEIYG